VEELTQLLGREMHDLGDFCDLSKSAWGYPKKLSLKEIIEIKKEQFPK
jgi:hypothetical protein